ncbi:MAG: SusC/RagA family TonB-linked outer membrane protein [Sphingobacteriaceae bacterium]|nr:MAG: SusC/RagA family TonB-linked outer membrane protein [Sphingobacteriaceae bacterium]
MLSFDAAAVTNTINFQQAQPRLITLKGTIVDDNDSQPLISVTISNNQKKPIGTTNAQGQFSVTVAAGTPITISYIGYGNVQQTFDTPVTNLTIRLKSSSSQLNEVVVTALGIRREEKALGYAVTTLKNKDVTDAVSNNWTNSLQGKVAGLNLIKSGGGPAGSNKVILRGESNLSGDNAALIVVDGVVISGSSGRSSSPGSGSGNGSYLQTDNPADFGNSLADINPDDIESVSVLKGPAAAALYGARASNGAVIITTKSGNSKNGSLNITINSNTSIDKINRWPDYQNQYGQGASGQDLYYSYLNTADGLSTRSTSSAWGPKFDGQSYFQYDPVTRTTSANRLPWVAYPDNHKNFFQTGHTFLNSISIDGGNDKSNARLSVTNLQNQWIIPNTGYKRNTLSFTANNKLTDKLQLATKINYTNKTSDNLPSTGYNNQSIMYFIRGLTPNMDIDWFKEYWLPGQEGISQTRPFSSLLDNPYLISNEMLNKSDRHNIIGNISATYNFTKNLSLLLRTSLDMSYEERSQQRPKSTNKFVDGMYRTQEVQSREITNDFLLRYNNKFASKFTYNLTLGGSRLANRYHKEELRADRLQFPNVYTLANTKVTLIPIPFISNYNLNSVYGLGSLAYNNYLFLDVTARNDWTSTLATETSTENASYFFPSVSLSGVLSDILKMPSQVTFLKVRASFAQTGSGGTIPYRTTYTYAGSIFPGSLFNPLILPNTSLQPQRTRSYELGTDIRLFQNRLSFDLAVYRNNTDKQILEAPVDRSSGYNSTLINNGLVRNQGIEVAVNATPVKTRSGFTWTMLGTFTANRSKIVSLSDSSNAVVLNTGPRGTLEARVGSRLGDIYGTGYERAPDGQIIYANGLPVTSTAVKYIGNAYAKFKASAGSTFSYKKFNLSVLFDGQWGGVAYSLTTAVLSEEGKLGKTIPGRYNGIVGNGVVRNANGGFSPNNVVATNIQAYYNAHFNRDNVESNTFSTDFIKFREARLDYSISPKVFQHIKIKRASIGVYGRDLIQFTRWPGFDPEFGTLSADGDIGVGFETAQFPSTRTFGLNITVGI